VQFEGGFGILRTAKPGLHLLRGVLIVIANMTYFVALAALPLASVTALFFVAPLFITVLSIPILGEKVGPRRIAAVVVGFCGVLVMIAPGAAPGPAPGAVPESAVSGGGAGRLLLLLPVAAALAYALMQMLTRRLGIATKASAMAVYIQSTFIVVSLCFWAVAGDGRYAAGVENESLQFLLRAWRWPSEVDFAIFGMLGAGSAVIGYSLSQAYRTAAPATVAPFEYTELPMAVFWGWLVWGELPGARASAGIALIMGAGLYVFLREKQRRRPVSSRRAFRRW